MSWLRDIKRICTEGREQPPTGNFSLIIALCAFIFMGRIIMAFSSVQNPVTTSKVEKRGKAYLDANYPGLYEQVKTRNSGTANQMQDGNWSIHYFQREDNSNRFSGYTNLSFNIVFDNELNIIVDGYKDYYLKGGTVYNNHSSRFYYNVRDILYPSYDNKPIPLDGDFVEKLYDYDLEDTRFYEAGDYTSYTGDYFDPDMEYDQREMEAKYGRIDIKMAVENGTYDDYVQAVKSVVRKLDENNQQYNSLHLYMYFRDNEIFFCDADFTKEQIDAGLDSLIENESFVYTRTDEAKLKAQGLEVPTVEVGSFSDFIKEIYKEFKEK